VKNISLTVQDRDIDIMEDKQKSHVAYQMAQLPMTLSDPGLKTF